MNKFISINQIIAKGNLRQMRQRIEAGERLHEAPKRNNTRSRSALELAVKTGFHGMVDLLLEEAEWGQDDKGYALYHAADMGRDDLVSLLLDNGAPPQEARFADIISMMDTRLIDHFLAVGAKFDENDAFYEALALKRARPLLRIFKKYRKQHPDLEDQIAKALVDAVDEKKVRWAIMLIWAGADPKKRVASDLRGSVEDDPWNTTNAVETACRHNDLEYYDTLKFGQDPSNLRYFLWHACICRERELIRQIVERLPGGLINDPEKVSCSALEVLIGIEEYHRRDYSSYFLDERAKGIAEAIEVLVDAGAKWNPEKDDLRHDRKGLASHGAKHVVRVIRLLTYTPGAAPFETLWKLCNSATTKSLIQSADYSLWRELQEKARDAGLLPQPKRRGRRAQAKNA